MNLQHAEDYAEKLKGFASFAPHLAQKKLIPVIGCWSIPPQVEKRLTELGIYAMQMGSDTMEFTNAAELDSKYL